MMRLRSYILPLILSAGLSLTGCHSAIMSDLTDCPQYTVFTFDVATPDEISYPDGKIDDIRVFAFDEAGTLIGEWIDGEVAFLPGYEMRTDYYRPGVTSFVAWAGKDLSYYDFGSFKAGAQKEDLIALMAVQGGKHPADVPPLYVGEPVGGALTQEDRTAQGTVVDEVHFRLHQITNHFNVTIEGLPAGHDYTMTFTAKNDKYDASGMIRPSETFEWTARSFDRNEDGTVTLNAEYDILKLEPGMRGDYFITVTDETGAVVYSFDPLHDYILYTGAAMDGENPFKDHLDLNHEFNIRIRLQNISGTYMAVEVTIQSWNLVFRYESL